MMKKYELVKNLINNKQTFEEAHLTLSDIKNDKSNDCITRTFINDNLDKLSKLYEIEKNFYNKHKNDSLDELKENLKKEIIHHKYLYCFEKFRAIGYYDKIDFVGFLRIPLADMDDLLEKAKEAGPDNIYNKNHPLNSIALSYDEKELKFRRKIKDSYNDEINSSRRKISLYNYYIDSLIKNKKVKSIFAPMEIVSSKNYTSNNENNEKNKKPKAYIKVKLR